MYRNPSRAEIAFRVLIVTLRIVRRVLRRLLRSPLFDVLLLLLVLYVIASLIGGFNQPKPLLYQPPTRFEGR